MDYAGRRAHLRQQIQEQGIDLVAVSPGDNMRYLLGFATHPDERPCYLLLTAHGEGMLMPELNALEARHYIDLPMEVYSDADSPLPALQRLAETLGFADAKRVLVDETMRADFVFLLHEAAPSAQLASTTALLGAMRMRKDPAEVEALKANALTADAAMRAAYAALRPGMTEAEVADVVAAAFAEQGTDKLNFAIIASGPHGAFPHHATGQRKLKVGDTVILDIGASMQGYNSDLTRVAFLGEPDEEFLQVHAIVNRAVEAALAVIHPGAPLSDVDKAARQVITEAGYGEYFTHRTGHGIGMTVHEPPYVTHTNDIPIEVGMSFSVEPGIYLPDKFGVRLEEIVVVEEEGPRILSELSRDVYIVRPA